MLLQPIPASTRSARMGGASLAQRAPLALSPLQDERQWLIPIRFSYRPLRKPPFTLRHTHGERGRYRHETATVRAEPVAARTANGLIESRVDITSKDLRSPAFLPHLLPGRARAVRYDRTFSGSGATPVYYC
jgi:hypothetical protein